MDRDAVFDALQGWLLLLAFAVLVAPPPWSPFGGAPDTESLGAGLALLLALPPLLVALLRVLGAGARVGIPLGFPLLLGVAAWAAARVGEVSDTFQGWRSLLALIAAVAYVAAGASLGAAGRRVLQRGLPFTALLLFGSALLMREPAGSLGNTGDLSEAALAGAILGAGTFQSAKGAVAFAGFAALLLYAIYVGSTPVYAGVLGLGAAAAFSLGASVLGREGGENGRRSAAKRARLLLVALLVAVATTAATGLFGGAGTTVPASPQTATSPWAGGAEAAPEPDAPSLPETGGVAFRRLTWARIPALLEDHGRRGVGPGQFQAAFPAYRDPAEIELSTFGRAEPTPIEVEHAHNEVLTALAEYGWIGGGAFALFLLLVLWRGASAIAGEDSSRRDFGIAAIALLAVSLVNAPLLYGPAAPVAAFIVFGVVLAHRPAEGSRRITDVLGLALPVAAVLLTAGDALSFVRHGRAMAEVVNASETRDGRERNDPAKLGPLLERALAARPDSPIALEKKAQLLLRTGAPPNDQREVLERLLASRPNSIAALQNAGVLQARTGNVGDAAVFFDAAYELDPANPSLLGNRLRLAIDLRDPARAHAAIEALRAAGRLEAAALRIDAIEALVGGRLAVAQPILSAWLGLSGEPDVDTTDANALVQARTAAKRGRDDDLTHAYTVASKMALALELLRDGDFLNAETNARLAYQWARDFRFTGAGAPPGAGAGAGAGVDTGATRLRVAAAHAGQGHADEARAILDEAPIRPVDASALADVEREALASIGVRFGPSMDSAQPADPTGDVRDE